MSNSTCVCAADVHNNSNCPLCGRHIRNGERSEHYPAYEWGNHVKAQYLLKFLFIISGAITLCIDFLVGFNGWSIHCVVGLLMLWFIVFKPIFAQVGIAAVIVRGTFFVCLWAIAMHVWGQPGFKSWPLSYLMPGSVALGITLELFFSVIRQVKWSEVGVYVLTLGLYDAVFLVLALFGLIPSMTLIVIVLMYSISCLFTLRWFLKRRFMTGFHKRLRV